METNRYSKDYSSYINRNKDISYKRKSARSVSRSRSFEKIRKSQSTHNIKEKNKNFRGISKGRSRSRSRSRSKEYYRNKKTSYKYKSKEDKSSYINEDFKSGKSKNWENTVSTTKDNQSISIKPTNTVKQFYIIFLNILDTNYST
jgi:hypothetical protein